MTRITNDNLLYWARLLGIEIMYRNLHNDLLGQANATEKIITLDRALKFNPRQLKCILAEEIGHILYPPRPGHTRYHSAGFYRREDCSIVKHTVAQDERKARDWATNVLMPDVEFNRIMECGIYAIGEIAELFEVEPWLVEHKIGYYRRREQASGRKVKWRNIIRRV